MTRSGQEAPVSVLVLSKGPESGQGLWLWQEPGPMVSWSSLTKEAMVKNTGAGVRQLWVELQP